MFPLQAEVFKLETTKLTILWLFLALVPVTDLIKLAIYIHVLIL